MIVCWGKWGSGSGRTTKDVVVVAPLKGVVEDIQLPLCLPAGANIKKFDLIEVVGEVIEIIIRGRCVRLRPDANYSANWA
jgi:hypothetical protein